MTITRGDLLRIFVLNEVADDFENLEKVARECGLLAAKCGFTVRNEDVVQTIASLISGGLVRAVWLSGTEPPRSIDGVPNDVDFACVYFAQTEEGERRHSENLWPLDECGNAVSDLVVTLSTS